MNNANGWNDAPLNSYVELINNSHSCDSHYLRTKGLKNNILKLLQDTSTSRLLDIGCGDGWLLKKIKFSKANECDIAILDDIKDRPHFSKENICKLSYDSNSFDIVVASLVLMWLNDDEFNKAIEEMLRVTVKGGKAIVCIMHPYFYNAHDIQENKIIITKDLSRHFSKSIRINEKTEPFTYYYRSISYYLNTFVKAGWTYKNMFDWYIDMDDYNAQSFTDQKKKRTGKIPLYTFFTFSK